MRKHYIALGVLIPDQPTKWESSRSTLRLDEEGKASASRHIYEYEYNKYMNLETDFPLEQLPECVRSYWEENGKF